MNLKEIKEQAQYCLNCKTKPCVSGCPLQNNIPNFIKLINEERYNEAYKVLLDTTIFESICGRICPHDSQCAGKCIRGLKGNSVNIGELEAFVGDYALENIDIEIDDAKKENKKIAIIGSGPSGLAASYYLSSRGIKVDIYEKHSKLGGLLRHGIPEFRLEKRILDKWLDKYILNKNVTVFTNMEFGKDIFIDDLKLRYDIIILAIGSNVSCKMDISGEDKEFVLGGNELLEYRNMPNFTEKNVVIIGGGNVAMDVSRTIKKLGAKEVRIVYRRSEKQMPAERKEIEDAKKEGIEFLFKTNIIKILDKKIECVKTQLVKKEGEIRESPVNIEGSNFFMDVDFVILAVGSTADKKIIDNLKIETNKWGNIMIDNKYRTSDDKIYAIGDVAGMRQTVAWAVKSGFECAKGLLK